MKAKIARRWLKRNQHKIAQAKIDEDGKATLKREKLCLKILKENEK